MTTNKQLPWWKPDSVLVLAGATGSGKSALALEIVSWLKKEFSLDAEIICADSITIYKGFSIGSAKPSLADQAKVPHHLLDIKEAHESFTAADFVEYAMPIVQRIQAEKKLPFLVGGTGFYLRAFIQGMAEESPEQNQKSLKIKAALEERAKIEGPEKLYQEMLEKDPALKGKIHPQDQYRVIRALQAMASTGKRWSTLNEEAKNSRPRFPHYRYLCLQNEKTELTKQLQNRTQKMLEDGLVEEVEKLLASGVSESCKPMQSIGYKEVLDLKKGHIAAKDLASTIVQSSLRLAKSQNTWFRGEKLRVEFLQKPFLESAIQKLLLESAHDQ